MPEIINPALIPGHYDSDDGFRSKKYGRTGFGHTGIDIVVPSGTDFPALATGTVVWSGWEPTGGNGWCMVIDIDDSPLYVATLHGAAQPVAVGTRVTAGQKGVYTSGNSGSNSQGSHVHITLSDSPTAYRGGGNLYDPWAWLNGGSTGAGSSLGYDVREIQRLLTARGFATTVDGQFGPDTTAKVIAFQKSVGITADGIVGPTTWANLNAAAPAPAPAPAPTGLAVDGQFGPATIAALQRILGVAVDGQFGGQTARALQAALGVPADGSVGPQTIRALQARVGATADGDWGPGTTRALQARLNTGAL